MIRKTIALLVVMAGLTTKQILAGNFEVNNNKVLHNGQQITLRGVNWFGLESPPEEYTLGGLDSRDYKDMIGQIKSIGFNAVRIPYCPATLKNQVPIAVGFQNGINADLKNKGTLDILDAVVNEMERQQIYILLDAHREDCRTIGNLWYTDQYPESQWIADLKFLAQRYQNKEYFLGLDLKNEPHGQATWGTGNNQTDWNSAAERAGREINSVNSNILIFIEGIQDNPNCSSNIGHWQGGNLEPYRCRPIDPGAIPANKLVLSPHVYGPDVYQQQYFFDQNFPRNMEAIWETHFGFLSNMGLTVVPGEWGGKYGNGGNMSDRVWQDSLVDYFIKKGICSSFYWDLNPNSSDTGGILQDDWRTPWQNKLDLLNRYYTGCGGQNTTPTVPVTTNSDGGSVVEIDALGTPAGGVYPNMELWIDNQKAAEFNDIRGNSAQNQFVKLTYSQNVKISSNQNIVIKFVNDAVINGEDRNLRIDKIVVDGMERQSEDSGRYSQGSWNRINGCGGGYKASEWLHCNGYLEFNLQSVNFSGQSSDYKAEYFENIDLSGSPMLVQSETNIDYNWSYSQPNAQIRDEYFSARWAKSNLFESGNYEFTTVSDDGVRLFIDGRLVIDQWNDHAARVDKATVNLTSGNHEIKMEYYERGGEAVAKLYWQKM